MKTNRAFIPLLGCKVKTVPKFTDTTIQQQQLYSTTSLWAVGFVFVGHKHGNLLPMPIHSVISPGKTALVFYFGWTQPRHLFVAIVQNLWNVVGRSTPNSASAMGRPLWFLSQLTRSLRRLQVTAQLLRYGQNQFRGLIIA